jgi:hypothetical protein
LILTKNRSNAYLNILCIGQVYKNKFIKIIKSAVN